MAESNLRTIRGQLVASTGFNVKKIQLFDGKFTTGFRLKGFKIAPRVPTDSLEMTARILTTDLPHGTNWNWDRNDEIGWAAWNVPINSRFGEFSLVDEEAIIVEDLYVDVSATADEVVNYWIEIEKLSFSEWKGALAMVQARSQAALPE